MATRASICGALALLSPAILLPALSGASFVPFHAGGGNVGSGAEKRAIAGISKPSTDIPHAESTFHVLARDGDDDALELKFEIHEPSEPVACGHSSILVNGYALEHQWSGSDLETTGSGKTLLIAPEARTRDHHSLEVSSRAFCVPTSADAPSTSSSQNSEPNTIGVVHLQIEKLDDRPTDSGKGLTISFDQATGRIISGIASPSATIDELSTQQPQSTPTSIDGEGSEQSDEPGTSLDNEIEELNSLEEDLKHLKKLVRQKKIHVNRLAKDRFTGLKHEFQGCENIKCVAQKIYQKAKSCLHTITLRFAPKGLSKSLHLDRYCGKLHGVGKMENATDSKNHGTRYLGQARTGQKQFHSAQSGEAPQFQHHQLPLDEDEDQIHGFIAIFGILASIFCLSCVGVSIHRSCCNPRKRVERLARREERRTRRQYCLLAWRKKMKDQWDCLRGRKDAAMGDYEEKRALILNQERILEDEMQEEISRLYPGQRRPDEAIAAEEGRATSRRGSETLPEYRSRTNSGRPPSYRELDETSVFTPNGTTTTTTTTTVVTVDSDSTPDSSVANLSPRHSSETLRSERSLV
ncbi:MAG: hypothetical protein M1831_004431 [Alyxoria varia]|nr:MAG: hypothetical protein M1831_004431 [Alyxoria varia]